MESLNIIVVGGGIGGLSVALCLGKAGHTVTVLESATTIKENGAGLQVGPNMSRLLIRWGLGPGLDKVAVRPESIALCRYDTGEQVGLGVFGKRMEYDYGAPFLHVHRKDLMHLLLTNAEPYVRLRLGCRVNDVDTAVPSVTLNTGEVLNADIIIGADGIHSVVRDAVVGAALPAIPTGDAVYRAMIPVSSMLKDPELKELVDPPQVHCWMGPERHVIGYCVSAGEQYNMVLVRPDNDSIESWLADGDVEELRATFVGWDRRIQKLLSLVQSTQQTKLILHAHPQRWMDQSSQVVLLGDAAHPMLPYRAQAAAMAVEDAAVLGNLLSRVARKCDIPSLLHQYQAIRESRVPDVVRDTWLNRHTFHMPDGPQQELRDKAMKAAMNATLSSHVQRNSHTGNSNVWADNKKNVALFSYDADEHVDRVFTTTL